MRRIGINAGDRIDCRFGEFSGARDVCRLRNLCGLGNHRDRTALRYRLGPFRARRIGIGRTEDFRRKMARPARLLPAGKLAGDLGLIENHVVAVVVEQRIDIIQMRFDFRIKVDHDDARARLLQRLAVELGGLAFVDDRRAGSRQRIA